MSSYPPPPPPYNPYTMRAQARAMRQAAKAQRRAAHEQRRAVIAQARYQRRGLRRRSIVGPLLLLFFGTVFLLAQLGRISWSGSLDWFARWWPAVLIVAGLLLLLEWTLDQRRHPAGTRSLGAGVIFLLVLLVLAGLSSRALQHGIDWRDHTFGPDFSHFDRVFGQQHDAYDDLSTALPAGAALTIHNPHGDVTVTGTSTDGQVHVSVHKQAYAWNDTDVDRKDRSLQPAFSGIGQSRMLTVATVEGGQADLTVTVPANSPITINSGRGDVTVSRLRAPLSLSANHGDVNLSDITGDVQASVNDDDASLDLHTINGNVLIEGHSGDISVVDVTGALTLQGEFFGSTHIEHVSSRLRFQTNRTNFSAARLDDELSIEKDSLDASQLLGPIVLKTSNKNITLDRVAGDVDLADSNGSVAVTSAPPLGVMEIANRHGSVDVGLPAGSGFVLNAQTRNGDMENDFGLSTQSQDDTKMLRGTFAGGGPGVTVTTSDGDVTVHKSSVPPLPPAPPAMAKIASAPPAMAKPPKAPHAPSAPTPPAVTGTNF